MCGGVVWYGELGRLGARTYVRPVERRTPARKADTAAWSVVIFRADLP